MANLPKVICKEFDHNRQVISYYDLLRYREKDIRRLLEMDNSGKC